MSYSVLIFLLQLYVYNMASSQVRWVLRPDSVTFGDNVTLFCYLPPNFDVSFPRQWKTETMVVAYDEAPSDRNKYEGSLTKNGFTLKIKQFAVGDFRRNYTCSYGFDEYMANLTTENYQWNPQPGTYGVDVLNSTVESVKVKVRFKKVYPEPNCISLIGQRPIQAEFIISSHVVDRYFREINLTLEYLYNDFDCGEEVFISCYLVNNSETILTENITTRRQCEDICQKFSPCLNNGTCKSNKSSIRCDCTDDYSGTNCGKSNSTTTPVFITTAANADTEPDTWVKVTVPIVCALVVGLIVLAYRREKKLCTAGDVQEPERLQVENYVLNVECNTEIPENEKSKMEPNGPSSMQQGT